MQLDQAAAEAEIMQFIAHENGEIFMNYVQNLQDFAIGHIADADNELIFDTIPAINQFLKLLRAYNKAGTLLISE